MSSSGRPPHFRRGHRIGVVTGGLCLALQLALLTTIHPDASGGGLPTEEGNAVAVLEEIQITVVYDDHPFRPGLKPAWGFAAVVEGLEKALLFDTGADGRILLANMETLGIHPTAIDAVVLSHDHPDHVGGLDLFLQSNPDVSVYLPKSFPVSFKSEITSRGAHVVEVDGAVRICAGVYSTGVLGTFVEEQSLIVATDRGAIVLTGCAHPQIVRIVDKAMDLTGEETLLVAGGFHLMGETRLRIRKVIARLRDLGVTHVGPCHCSGDCARELFRREFGAGYLETGVGRVISAKDLQ